MTHSEQDNSFIEEALPAFISEAQEQTESLEQLLLQIEHHPGDRELLDALFRCAHTVKGSAGIFGLDRVVAFTHHMETLLDEVREGRVSLTPELSTLLLQCNDEVRALISSAREPEADSDPAALARQALVERLQAASGREAATGAGEAHVAASPEGQRRWFLSARFGTETFRNGMDPLAIMTYLRGLGEVPSIACDSGAVPALEALDPESCHLGFEFSLDTAASRSEIEAAFSFVREDCELHLIEPGATPEDFAALIGTLPDHTRLGDILVSVGAITRVQLQQALAGQAAALSEAGRSVPLGEMLQNTAGLSPLVVNAALDKQQGKREPKSNPTTPEDNHYIRVQADRLDKVINLLGELVMASAGAALLARQTRQRSLMEANEHIGALVEEIRNGTLQLRMVPISETFSRFRRVVRDTASELGKDVRLEIQGGETELDKSVVERIADPLMHLVRNALDHGLEAPAERQAAGKSAQGTLTMSACHESGSILIGIHDDGRGIDRDRVLARAWDRGLLERGVVPPDAEILRLIFEPGFSTAEKVTNLSGRGVGMDVVRRNIESLRGSVTVHSEPGRGSAIEIRMPLTLAIIDGFLVGMGPSKFIFPLDAVVEVIENRPTATGQDARGRGVIELRGQVLPVVNLRALYALDSVAPARSSVIIIQAANTRYGVMVDQLLGQHQTVIKPLGRMFRSLRGMSGSSILGSGEVALIFDVLSLGRLAAELPGPSSRAQRDPGLPGHRFTPTTEGQKS